MPLLMENSLRVRNLVKEGSENGCPLISLYSYTIPVVVLLLQYEKDHEAVMYICMCVLCLSRRVIDDY